MKTAKRTLALLLTVCLLCSTLFTSAFAAEGDDLDDVSAEATGEEKVCTCEAGEGEAHAETCDLYVAPTEEEEITEEEPTALEKVQAMIAALPEADEEDIDLDELEVQLKEVHDAYTALEDEDKDALTEAEQDKLAALSMLLNPVETLEIKDTDVAAIGETGYETLAAAIQNANDNDTVELKKNVTIDETLVINKSIILQGNGHSISGNVSSGSFISVDTTGNFSMLNCVVTPTSKVTPNAAINLKTGGVVTITGCIFGTESGNAGVMYNGLEFSQTTGYELADGTTISNNTFYGNSFRHNCISFYLMDENATININNNNFVDLNWDTSNAARISNYSGAHATVNFDGNTYSEHGSESADYKDWAGLFLFQNNKGSGADLDINITNLDYKGTSGQLCVFYQTGNTAAPTIIGDKSVEDLKVISYGASANGVSFVADVDGKYYTSLEDAIAAAKDGDEVHIIKEGTYNESLVIDKDITLVGDCDGEVVISSTSIDAQDNIEGTNTPYSGIITVKNADVTLKNITVKGDIDTASTNTQLTHNTKYIGVAVLNSNVVLENCNIMDITYTESLQGMQNGFGVYAAGNGSVKLVKTDISKFNKCAVITRAGIALEMDGCTVTGFGEQGIISQNGVQTGDTTTIKNCTITGLQYKADDQWNGGSVAIFDFGTQMTLENVNCADVDYSVYACGKDVEIISGNFEGYIAADGTGGAKLVVKDGFFEKPVDRDYLDPSLKAELYSKGSETPYSYYTDVDSALEDAKSGDTVTDLTKTGDDAEKPSTVYTVTLAYENGTENTNVNVVDSYTLPSASRSGYKFQGWKTGSKTYGAGEEVVITADTTFTAQWKKKKSSSGGNSSSTSSSTSIDLDTGKNGDVSVSPKKPGKGDKVTITVEPDDGYILDTIKVTDEDGDKIKLTEKGENKFTFTMPSGEVTIETTFTKADGEDAPKFSFIDVSTGDWFAPAVDYVSAKGMMNGSNGYFSPYDSLTRGMIAQILYNLEGGTGSFAIAYPDVSGSDWYANAVSWVSANGIMSGYGSGLFGANDSVTREQLALTLYSYARAKGYNTTASVELTAFADGASTSEWAKPAMQWAVANGLFSGKTGNRLDPQGTATRAEVASILMRFCETIAK